MTSSLLRTGSTPRRTVSLAGLMALLVALSFGFVTSAGAEPTQSPSAAATDPSAADPTPEPDATTPAVPTTPTPTIPTPTTPSESVDEETEATDEGEAPPNPDPTSEPGASSEPNATTGPESSDDKPGAPVDTSAVRSKLLSTARSGPSAAAGITANAAISEGGNLMSLSIPGCAPVGGDATLDGLLSFIDEEQVSQDESLDWQIEGPGVSRSGTVSFDGGVGEFTVPGLAQGDYTLVFSLEGGVQLEDAFTVIGCVTTTVSCAAISFTNPSTNPAVTVAFGPVVDGDEFDEDSGDAVQVAPGRTVTGQVGYPNIGWSAYWSDPFDVDGDELPEGIFRISSAGDVENVAIPQAGCAASVTAVGVVCRGASDSALATLTIAKLEPLSLYYEVWERSGSRPVANGEIAPGATTASVTATLRADKTYEFLLYVENAEDPYDVTDLELSDCSRPSTRPTADEDDSPPNPVAEPSQVAADPVPGAGAVLADTGSTMGPAGLAGIGLLAASGVAMIIAGRRRQLS